MAQSNFEHLIEYEYFLSEQQFKQGERQVMPLYDEHKEAGMRMSKNWRDDDKQEAISVALWTLAAIIVVAAYFTIKYYLGR